MIPKILFMLQKIFILLFAINQIGFSQDLFEQSFYSLERPENSGEEIYLETDRQFYCIDERIYFEARYAFNHPIDDVHWSSVLYLELIKWNGDRIEQAKFRLHENRASGYLTIPKTLLSGNYYIRAYTKWMRNYPLEDYHYKLVKVINPFENKIDQGPVQLPEKVINQGIPVQGKSIAGIECFTNKTRYKQREKVELSLRLSNPGELDSNFCVSVAKAAYIDTSTYFIQLPDELSPDEKSLKYLPEFRGISISGKILNTHTPGSVENADLHLSTPQNWKYFTTFHTKETELFYFTLPDFYGQYDFYIDAELDKGERADILIDNDYCNRPINLTYVPFSLDSIEKEIALEMVVNMQLSKMYNDESKLQEPESGQVPFYGEPTHVYYTSEYITLPNLEEFFFELVNEVRAIREEQQTHLKLLRYSRYQNLKSLVLLDNIPVLSVDELLKLPIESIEKVEIFDQPYNISGIMYSGIICVSTREKDFGGITLNKNSRFFSYELLSEGDFIMPDYGSKTKNRITHRNNLLFWASDIEVHQNDSKNISFYTSDSKGEYVVYVRSINTRGKPQIFGTCKILVE